MTATTGAAVAAAVILGGLAVFQFALALGAPYGRFAWGGSHRVLPTGLRIASLVTMAAYASATGVITRRSSGLRETRFMLCLLSLVVALGP